MSRETKTKTIGEYTYHVTQLGTKAGGRVMVRLIKMIGVAAGEAMQDAGKGADFDFDAGTVGKILSNLAGTLGEADFDYLCDSFVASTEVTGSDYGDKRLSFGDVEFFDFHFAGSYFELGQWLLFAIEANGFLGKGGLAAMLRQAAALRQASQDSDKQKGSSSTSPNTSTQAGISGA